MLGHPSSPVPSFGPQRLWAESYSFFPYASAYRPVSIDLGAAFGVVILPAWLLGWVLTANLRSDNVKTIEKGGLVEWRQEYETGVPAVDQQHRQLFRMAGEFQKAVAEGRAEALYGRLLGDLTSYCQSHFGFEEHCMEQRGCPVARKNKVAHEILMKILGDFHARYAENGFDSYDARRLAKTLTDWLVNHIARIDSHLKNCRTP